MLRAANSSKLVPVECPDLARLGSPHHGGYVVPLGAVHRTKHLLSFGISYDWAFETEFQRLNPTTHIHCYDHTISAPSAAAYSLKNFLLLFYDPSGHRLQKALKYFSYRSFFKGRVHHHRNRVWYNHDEDSVTMRDAFAEAARGEIFLKLDIEGSEYRILHDVTEFADRIDAMVIAFHDIDIMADSFDDAVETMRRHFHIVHVHGNNRGGVSPAGFPNVLEVTFQNRRLFEGEPPRSTRSYPVRGLDARNDPTRPDVMLHFGS
jgi:hypothetical protein